MTAHSPHAHRASTAFRAAAEWLRVLAHPHRLRIVELLLAGEYTVAELAAACEIPSHMASEHLILMKRSGLLTAARDGRKTYYRVFDPVLRPLLLRIREWFAPEPRNSGAV